MTNQDLPPHPLLGIWCRCEGPWSDIEYRISQDDTGLHVAVVDPLAGEHATVDALCWDGALTLTFTERWNSGRRVACSLSVVARDLAEFTGQHMERCVMVRRFGPAGVGEVLARMAASGMRLDRWRPSRLQATARGRAGAPRRL